MKCFYFRWNLLIDLEYLMRLLNYSQFYKDIVVKIVLCFAINIGVFMDWKKKKPAMFTERIFLISRNVYQ